MGKRRLSSYNIRSTQTIANLALPWTQKLCPVKLSNWEFELERPLSYSETKSVPELGHFQL